MNKWKLKLLEVELTDKSFAITIGELGHRIPEKKRDNVFNWTCWYLFSLSFWNKRPHIILFNYRINYPKS